MRAHGTTLVSVGTTPNPHGTTLVSVGTTPNPHGTTLVRVGTTSVRVGTTLVRVGTTSNPVGTTSDPVKGTCVLEIYRFMGCGRCAPGVQTDDIRDAVRPKLAATCGSLPGSPAFSRICEDAPALGNFCVVPLVDSD
jgi:hypothetical protein